MTLIPKRKKHINTISQRWGDPCLRPTILDLPRSFPVDAEVVNFNMPPRPQKGEYIETDTGNKVSRKSHIVGTPNIILGGKTIVQAEVCLRGDLHRLGPPGSNNPRDPNSPGTKLNNQIALHVGRYAIFSPRSVLRPPYKPSTHAPSSSGSSSASTYLPQTIAGHVYIGPGVVCEAASVGSHVYIGAGSVIGRFVIIKDYVKVLDGSVLPQGMVVPSGCVVAGRPARVVGEVGEGWGVAVAGGVGPEGEKIDGGGDMRDVYRRI